MVDDTIQTTLRLSPELHEELRKESYETKVSINKIIVDRLEKYRETIRNLDQVLANLEKQWIKK